MHTLVSTVTETNRSTDCPYITCYVQSSGDVEYCVHSLNTVFCHRQRWQVEWKLMAMCAAAHLRTGDKAASDKVLGENELLSG